MASGFVAGWPGRWLQTGVRSQRASGVLRGQDGAPDLLRRPAGPQRAPNVVRSVHDRKVAVGRFAFGIHVLRLAGQALL